MQSPNTKSAVQFFPPELVTANSNMLSDPKASASSSHSLEESIWANHLQNNYSYISSNVVRPNPTFRHAKCFNSSHHTVPMDESPLIAFSAQSLQNSLPVSLSTKTAMPKSWGLYGPQGPLTSSRLTTEKAHKNSPAQDMSHYKQFKNPNNDGFQHSPIRTSSTHVKYLKRAILNKDLPPLPYSCPVTKAMPAASTVMVRAPGSSKVSLIFFRYFFLSLTVSIVN